MYSLLQALRSAFAEGALRSSEERTNRTGVPQNSESRP